MEIDEATIEHWMMEAESRNFELKVDLEAQTITDDQNNTVFFPIDSYQKEKLVNGWDDIDITLMYEDKIRAYEEAFQK